MKSNSGQTHTQQKTASAATETAQKKKALSETLEFEDQRESSRAQADLQMSIDQSPRMIAQRKKITHTFGASIQRQTAFSFKTPVEPVSRIPMSNVKVHSKSSEPKQRKTNPGRSYPIQRSFFDDLDKMDNTQIQSMLGKEKIDVSLKELEALRSEGLPFFYTFKELKEHLVQGNQVGANEESEEEDKSSKPSLGSKMKAKAINIKNKAKSKLGFKSHDEVFIDKISESKYENYELKFHPPSVVDASLSAMQGATGIITGAYESLLPQRVKIKQFVIPSNDRWARYVAASGLAASGGAPVVGIISAPIGVFLAEHAKGKGVIKSLGKAAVSVPGASIDTVLGIVSFGAYSVITISAGCVAAAKDIYDTARSIYAMRDQCEAKLTENIVELENAYKTWKNNESENAALVSPDAYLVAEYSKRLAYLKRQLKKQVERRPDIVKWVSAGKERVDKAKANFQKVKEKAAQLKTLFVNATKNGYQEIPDEDPDISEDEESENDGDSTLSSEALLDLYDEP